MPLLLEPDKLESIDRVLKAIKSIDGPLKPLKTTQQIWRKVHSFEGYARDMPEMALFLLRFLSWVHAGHCWVPNKNKSGKMTPMVMHPGQIIVLNAMIEQAFEVKPIRLIIPKSRRQGVSTIVTAVFRFLCDHIPDRNARLSAHTEPSAKEIFDIVRRSHAKVLTDRANGKPHKYTDLAATEIKFERTGSVFSCMTAMGRHGGSGGKTDYLEISELAKMDKTSQQDLKALDSLLPTVTDGDPGTIVVIESTGQGTVGEFYKRTMAVLEGRPENDDDDTEDPYKCVFLPWTIDSMCREPRGAPKDFDGFKRPLSGYEIMLRDDFKCDPQQIYWRRKKLKERGCKDYGENPFSFAREFPLTVNECFLSATGRVYSMMVREPPYMQELPPSFFSQFTQHYRAIDWGNSEASPFVCLWIVVDPTKPAGFVVDPSCSSFWTELENYSFDERTGDPIKAFDHGCFDGETKFLIKDRGWTSIRDFVGQEGEVWTPAGWKPFWNVHKTGDLETIRTTFDDGFSVITTPDHEFWDGQSFTRIDNISSCIGFGRWIVEDILHGRPSSDYANVSGFQRQEVQVAQAGAVLQQREYQASPLRLGISQWEDSQGVSHPSQGWGFDQQLDRELGNAPWSRSSLWSHDRGTLCNCCKNCGSVCRSCRSEMAQERRRKAVSQMARKRELEDRRRADADLRNMRERVQYSLPKKERQVLRSELQDGRSKSQERLDCCRNLQASWTEQKNVVEKKSAGRREVFDLTIDDVGCAVLSNGLIPSNCDAARYFVSTMKPRGLVYVRKELYIRDFSGQNDPQTIARKVHLESDYVHPSGNPNDPDVSKFVKKDGAYEYQTGVADRARNDLISQFNKWGIPLIGYKNPHEKDSGKGIIHDGISMLQALMAGNVVFDPEPEDSEKNLAQSAVERLNALRPVEPSAAEWSAYHAVHGGDPEDAEEELSAGWY